MGALRNKSGFAFVCAMAMETAVGWAEMMDKATQRR
jgi:hypothetical protein